MCAGGSAHSTKTTDWSDGIPLDDYRGRGGWPEIRPTLLPALPRAPARIRHMRAGLVVAGFRPGEEEADDGERVAVLESDAVEVLFARGRRGGWRVELSLPDWDEWYPADAVLTALGPEHDAAGLLASLDALAAANPEVLLARVTARDAGREMHP